MSPSPHGSPILGPRRLERQLSSPPVSQPHVPQSNRDRKRSLIRDTFAAMEEGFLANKDSYYRINLQKIQIDINLIAAAETHGNCLLPNDPTEIEALVRESIQQNRMTQTAPESLIGAGRDYAEFAKECNDAMEERDTALAALHRDVTVKMTEIQSTYNYHQKLAYNEHNALRTTLRDRLINSVTNKKARLFKEKEIDINDNSALLLHPSQFGIANPSSPGGIHGKRATRNRRDIDETKNFPEIYKRKRKTFQCDDSPISARQRYESRSRVPSWLREKNNLMATQIDSPLYSIEKLFTEKELAMTYNNAALAAYSYIVRHDETESSQIHPSADPLLDKKPKLDTKLENEEKDSSVLNGVSSERKQPNSTKSSRDFYTSGFGIDALNDVNVDSNFQLLVRQTPKLPPISQSGFRNCLNKNEGNNSPASLSHEDITVELDLMRRARQLNDQKGLGYNLQADDKILGLLKEVVNPKGLKGRERWIASENRENLYISQKSGKTRERDPTEGSDSVTKKNSQA
ncbi:putative deacetylase complex subunit protein [Erysiphe necator]|uniref:Putative deacetylase complex subunit protein n=1 Tax=Uncinula necator TaxID=52586 RepID=A0A0B1PBH3_UNCNE|nr:putative deacetylase complex subunit protein [Erysiphe necator]